MRRPRKGCMWLLPEGSERMNTIPTFCCLESTMGLWQILERAGAAPITLANNLDRERLLQSRETSQTFIQVSVCGTALEVLSW